MARSYKAPPTPPEWYPAEIHKRVLSLDEWADEIAFRFSLRREADKRREMLREEGGYYSGRWYKKEETERLIKHMDNKEMRTGVLTHGESMGEPVEWISEKTNIQGEYRFSQTENLSRGFFIPIAVNIAYDNKTLFAEFEKCVNSVRSQIEYENFGSNKRVSKVSAAGYGERLYTTSDTETWFEKKLLDWIDIRLWLDLTDTYPSINNTDIAEILNVSESSTTSTLAPREKELMSFTGLFRLRASAKVAREQSPEPEDG